MYIKEEKFAEYAKGKAIKNYPNPYVKEVDGEMVNIIPKGEAVVFKKMSREDTLFYIGKVEGAVYEGTVAIGGWFPTELVCGVTNGRFSQETELAKKTGWLNTLGTFGSRNDAFREEGVKEAARLLEEAGYKVYFG